MQWLTFRGQSVHTRIRCRSKIHVKTSVYTTKENRKLRSLVHLLPGRSTVAVQLLLLNSLTRRIGSSSFRVNDATSCYQGARHGAAEGIIRQITQTDLVVVAGHAGATRVIVAMYGAALQRTGARSRGLTVPATRRLMQKMRSLSELLCFR